MSEVCCMDKHQHDTQPPSGRRRFLRQLGMTAAATAALSGLADVAGLKPAAAATRAPAGTKVRGGRDHASIVPDATVTSVTFECTLCVGCCDPVCTPSGVWCHNCEAVTWISGGIGVIGWAGVICIGNGSSFTLSGD
jgi:hypothetical protein